MSGRIELSPEPSVPATRLSSEDCRRLREQAGWSPEQLARAAGVAALTVLTFERDRRKPREETLIALRRAFRNAGLIGCGRREPGSEATAVRPPGRGCVDPADFGGAA